MAVCPSCKTDIGKAPASGICPECGELLGAPSRRTEVFMEPTMDLAQGQDAPRAPQSGARPADDLTAPTMPLPRPGSEAPDDQTAPTMPLPATGSKAADDQTAPTMPLPGTGKGKGRSVSIAPRKLSVQNMDLITGTWAGAAGDATPRTSLKFDSKTSVGTGSSLVVNPRGVRSVHSAAETTAGADYELLEVIGKGGMGVVYSARQASVDRLVAIKMIRPKVAADLHRREKFLSEAVVTGDLDHPNIVPIYELGTNENNALFYSMKRVKGTPWSKVIEQKSLNENLDILTKVADAVAFAHANGVVHRDLKPENVMLGDYGEVLVMDWGLALAMASFRHSEFVTGPDSMGGTPAYMAPEMVTGPFELIGPACDIYLLGAVLYEVVTGLVPHKGNTAQECLLSAARNEVQPCEQSGELVEIALKAMATDPADRFASVTDFQKALKDYQAHCDSVALATRADRELAEARQNGNYESFSHALFGFQEALALWQGNPRAEAGIAEAKLAYAQSAMNKGDYELGISLLDADNPEHATLRGGLEASQRERDARQKWLTRFKRIAAALVILVFGVISASLFVVAQAKNRETDAKEQAIRDRIAAEDAEKAAQQARQQEAEQKNKAIAAERKAKDEEALARAAEAKARDAEAEERKQKTLAIEAEAKAKEEEQKAILAKQGEEYAAYVARIGMAAARIEENAFDTAKNLLAACVPAEGEDDYRDWEWGHLMRLCRKGVDYSATGTVASVAFSPDRKWFVTAGADGQAHRWDRESGQQQAAIDHGAMIHAVAVSPDSRLVATGGGDGLVRIANAADGRVVHTLAGHEDRVLGVAFSPRDGRWLVSCSRDKTVRVWNTATGKEISGSPLSGHAWWVWSVAFAPDESRFVTAGQDGKVIVWGFDASGKEPAMAPQTIFLGHDGPVFAAAFSPDGSQIVSAGYDKRVLVWHPEKTGDVDLRQLVANEPLVPQKSRAFEGHKAPVRSVTFSPDGQFVLSGGDDNTVRVWDALTGKLHTMLSGHSRPVQSCAFSPNGRFVLSGGQEGQIKLWNLLNYREVRAPQGLVFEGHDGAVLSAAFSRSGNHIVTGGRDHAARVFDVTTGEIIHELSEGHEFLTSRAIYFGRGKWLLTAAGDGTARVWDAVTGSQLSVLEGTGRTIAVAVSPDGQWILTGKSTRSGQDAAAQDASLARLILWQLDPQARAPQARAFDHEQFGTGHRSTVSAVAVSPDATRLFSGDEAGLGKLWDTATGKEIVALEGHTRRITEAFFTPDSRRLLTSSDDGTVAQWDVATGRELGLVLSHVDPAQSDAYDAPVKTMALSPDGRQVLTLSEGTQDGLLYTIVRLWDADQARVVRELYRGPQVLTSIAFADDGRAALAAGTARVLDAAGAATEHGFVRRWDLSTGAEIESAAGVAYLDFAGRVESVWSAIEGPGGILTVGGNGASLWNPRSVDQPELTFKPHSGVTAAAFSADGRLVVTGSTDRRAKIWNAETGQCLFQLPQEHARAINSAAFSPSDDQLLMTASNDGTARLWSVAERRVLHVFEHAGPDVPVRCGHFTPDGKSLLTGGEDGRVVVWDLATSAQKGALQVDSPVLAIATSVDGRQILVGAANGRATLFDAGSGQPLVQYLGHTAAINAVALSPDGRRALTGSSDRSVKIWDTLAQSIDAVNEGNGPQDGKEILTLRHHDQLVTSVSFSPDGRSILTAGLDGTAVLWLADDWQPAPAAER